MDMHDLCGRMLDFTRRHGEFPAEAWVHPDTHAAIIGDITKGAFMLGVLLVGGISVTANPDVPPGEVAWRVR